MADLCSVMRKYDMLDQSSSYLKDRGRWGLAARLFGCGVEFVYVEEVRLGNERGIV